jgi:hypothetical protein
MLGGEHFNPHWRVLAFGYNIVQNIVLLKSISKKLYAME